MGVDLKNPNELRKYLDKIDRIFHVNKFLEQNIGFQDVAEYYKDSGLGYQFFHSSSGSIHMALNYDGKFNKQGYYGQAEIVQGYIEKNGNGKVLELASGKGFNSIYLAKQFPHVEFFGIDLTPEHVKYARNKSGNLPNLKFREGNFQNLDFQDGTFDLVFEIESVCHATNMEKALSEARRVLKPSGRFVVIDGFRSEDFDTYSEDMKIASKLSEVAMAVGQAWKINEWIALCEKVDFQTESKDDLSMAIMPNLLRFQFLARGFFKYPALSKLILKALPYYLVQNAIAGMLMPFTVEAKAQKYYKVALTRK